MVYPCHPMVAFVPPGTLMDLERLRYLVAIADTGSIQSAASKLRAARATVRRRLTEAEDAVGAPLFRRTSEGLVPTDAGAILVNGGREMMAAADVLVRAASSLHSQPRGELRVAVPAGIHPGLVDEVIGGLRASFPQLVVHLSVDNRPLTALLDTTDVAISVDSCRVPESWDVVGERVARNRLVASQSYLDAHAPVVQPSDLAGHPLFVYRPKPGAPVDRLPLLGGGEIAVEPAVTSNDILLLHHMAERGSGISWVPDGELPAILAPHVRMRPVLDDVVGSIRTVRLLVPKGLASTTPVRRILECFGQMLGPG